MELFAQIIGFLAMGTVFASLQIKNPRGTLWVMAVATALFSVHFGLLGAVTGSILNAINVFRSVAILYTDPKKRSGKIAKHLFSWSYFVAPFVFLLIPGVKIGIPDYVLGAVMMITTYMFWTQRSDLIRISQFFMISPGWIWYNCLSHSIPGIVTECLNMLSVVIFYVRQILGKSNKTEKI